MDGLKLGLIVGGVLLFLIGLALSVILIGIPILLIGLYMIIKGAASSEQQNLPIQQQSPQVVYLQAPTPPPQPAVVREREITREIVRVPCRYCGNLNDLATARFCSSCGAPIK